MPKFEKLVQGNLKQVIQKVDELLSNGKNALNFRDEYEMQSLEMDVTVRIYQRYNFILTNSTCITLIFQDRKDGNIKVTGLSSGDEYGVFGMNYGAGKRAIETCEKKLSILPDGNII